VKFMLEETVKHYNLINQLLYFEEMVFNVHHTVFLCLSVTVLLIHALIYSLIEYLIAIRYFDKRNSVNWCLNN